MPYINSQSVWLLDVKISEFCLNVHPLSIWHESKIWWDFKKQKDIMEDPRRAKFVCTLFMLERHDIKPAPHTNLESFFPRKDEVIALRPFVCCITLPEQWHVRYLIGEHSLNSLCYARQKTTQMYWRLSSPSVVMYSERVRCYGTVWKRHSSPFSSLSSLLPLITSQYISPSANTNETKRDLLGLGCQIHFQHGWGSQWDYVVIA